MTREGGDAADRPVAPPRREHDAAPEAEHEQHERDRAVGPGLGGVLEPDPLHDREDRGGTEDQGADGRADDPAAARRSRRTRASLAHHSAATATTGSRSCHACASTTMPAAETTSDSVVPARTSTSRAHTATTTAASREFSYPRAW